MNSEEPLEGKKDEPLKSQAGYVVQPNGYVFCPGVVCRCMDRTFCPMHGPQTTKDKPDAN